MNTSLRVNLICLDNRAGLSLDAELITAACKAAGFRTDWLKRSAPTLSWLRAERFGLHRLVCPRFDVNIFAERIWPLWIPFARRNFLIPNPEWLAAEDLKHLSSMDMLMCKTREAMAGLHQVHQNTRFLGFTSQDIFEEKLAASHPLSALHVAGRSPYKGTDEVLSIWLRHPEWPQLTVVRRPLDATESLPLVDWRAKNVRVLSGYLTEPDLRDLQRQSPIHICPSSVEGFGHSIVEAMAVGAVVITTNGPPMNEIVSGDRGVLLEATRGAKIGMGTHYHVSEDALESSIATLLTLGHRRLEEFGKAARDWFLRNDTEFKLRFARLLSSGGTDDGSCADESCVTP